MDVYLIQQGERRGPFRVFQIKELVETGAASREDLAWHQGMDEWRPLHQMESLAPFLPPPPGTPPPLPRHHFDQPRDQVFDVPRFSPPAARPGFPWRRIAARIIDWMLMQLVLGGAAMASGLLTPGQYLYPWPLLMVAFAVLWSLIEGVMISRWRTTPGKWLFSLRVEHETGRALTFGEASARAARAWFLGYGLGWPLLLLVTGGFWLYFWRKTGRSWWDAARGHRETEEPLQPHRLFLSLLYFAGQLAFDFHIRWNHPAPHYLPEPMAGRTLKEFVDQQMEKAVQSQPPPR